MHVLMLDGDGRQALPFLRALKRAGHHVTVACPRRTSLGYVSRYPDRRLLWPDYFHDHAGFVERMMEYIRRRRPDATLAVGDVSAEMLSRRKAELAPLTGLAVPDYGTFVRAKDKALTMAYAMEHGIPCPKTFFPDREDLEGIIARAPMPVMVKPREGLGAVGLHRIETAEDLRRRYETIRARYGELIIQEFIPQAGGMQFQAEAFCDAGGRMKACMVLAKPRFFPVTGGTSTANVTIRRPDIQESVRRLLEGIGWTGAADVDLILDPRDGAAKILEINPRVTAGIKIGFAAGIDYADLSLRLATGLPVPAVGDYRIGIYMRNLCMDMLWYVFATPEMRRTTWPPFFRFFGPGVKYQTLSADDPLTEPAFWLTNILKYADPKVWKAKLGTDLEGGPAAGADHA